MKRTFLALMCIASIALMTACGNNKEQNTDKTSESAAESVEQAKGSAPESVTRTKWFSESENSTYRLTISVEDNRQTHIASKPAFQFSTFYCYSKNIFYFC